MSLAVAVDVVEHQAFAQRQIAQRDVLGAELPQQRVEQHGAGDHQVGAPRVEAGQVQALLEVHLDRPSCAAAAGSSPARAGCALRSGAAPRSIAVATVPSDRIVPEVPITRSKPCSTMCSR